MLLSQKLATAQTNASAPALLFLGKPTNYGALKKKISQLSYLFQNELGQQVRVAYFASNAPAVVLSFFALANCRSVSIPLDPDASPEELGKWIRESEATVLAVTSDLLNRARDLLKSERLMLPILEIEKKQGGEYDAHFVPPAETPPKENDRIWLSRTRGSQNPARLVAFDHNRIVHSASSLRGLYRGGPNDRTLCTINWFHPFAFFHGMLYPLLTGSALVIDHGVPIPEYLAFLLENRVTRIVTEPEFALKLLQAVHTADQKLSFIKSITVGLGPISDELRALAETCNVPLLSCLGQTENGWTLAMEQVPEGAPEKSKSSKSKDKPDQETPAKTPPLRPIPGLKYKVIDSNGDEITGREARQGQLCVSGPSAMIGYASPDPKASEKLTKNVIRGTWLYTGDVAELSGDSENLEIRFIGRKSEVLEYLPGKFVSPEPIEHALRGAPGIQDVGAFILLNEKKKPFLACAVVRAEKSLIKEKDVLARCRQQLPEERRPLAVVFADDIPRLRGGSVHRHKLALRFAGTLPYSEKDDMKTAVTETAAVIDENGNPITAEAVAGAVAAASAAAAAEPAARPTATPTTPPPTVESEPEEDTAPAAPAEAPAPALAPAAAPAPAAVPTQAQPPTPTVTASNTDTATAPLPIPAPPPSPQKTKAPSFLTFSVEKLLPGEPLPASLYVYLSFRFVVFRAKGSRIDIHTFDRMEKKGVHQLFVEENDLPILEAWSAQWHAQHAEEIKPQDPRFEQAREEAKADVRDLFRSDHPEKKVAEMLNTGKKIVDEVSRSPFATNPLRRLQSYSKSTADHSVNVSILSAYLALQMGYSHAIILKHIAAGGLLHDIGKTLVKTGDADTPADVELKMMKHPELGAQLLQEQQDVPTEVRQIVLQHHEHHDGTGYPKKLRGSAIYDLAQIVSIANVFEGLVAHGQGPLSKRQADALREIENNLSSRFNPQKLAKAIKILKLGI